MNESQLCAPYRERLPEYVAGTLPPHERVEVEAHLAGCAACRREAAVWRAVGSALDAKDGMAPEQSATLEGATWRGIQARIAARGQASGSGLKERFLMDHDTAPVAPSTTPQRSAGPSRRQPLVALAAAALIIALSATLLGVYGARSRPQPRLGSASTSTATVGGSACGAGKVTAHLPAHAGLSDISMASATDGWAVGNIRDSNAPGAQPRTLMMRYQDCAWSEVGTSIPSAELLNVAMTSASDGWALGLTTAPDGASSWAPDQALLLQYTDGAWQRVQVNNSHGLDGGVLRMFSKDDGWLLLIYGRATPSITLYHFHGGAWTPVALPPGSVQGGIGGMFTYAADDVWIAGWPDATTETNVIAHYAAGHWQVWSPPVLASPTHGISAIRAISPRDVWVFQAYGYQGPSGGSGAPTVARYDGANWTRAPVSGLAVAQANWTATIARPDGSILALGAGALSGGGAQQPLIVQCSSSGCQARAFPVPNVAYIENISLYAPTQGFALGVDLSGVDPLTDPTSYGSVPALLTYNDGAWARVAS